MSPIGILLVLIATSCWGVSGLFIRKLLGFGLSPVHVVFYTSVLSFLVLFIGTAALRPAHVRVPWRALPQMMFVGACGAGLSFVMYTTALTLTTVSLTTILLYTAPAWVTLFAWRLLGESVGTRKVVSIGAAFVGCALVARIYDPEALRGDILGVPLGLGSGLTYALYLVLGKKVLERYHPLSLTLYGQLGAAALLFPVMLLQPISVFPIDAVPWFLASLLGPAILAPVAFNVGLRVLTAGLVALLAVWELVIAVILGVALLGEPMDWPQVIGALLVAGSVVALRPSESDAGAVAPSPLPVQSA